MSVQCGGSHHYPGELRGQEAFLEAVLPETCQRRGSVAQEEATCAGAEVEEVHVVFGAQR